MDTVAFGNRKEITAEYIMATKFNENVNLNSVITNCIQCLMA